MASLGVVVKSPSNQVLSVVAGSRGEKLGIRSGDHILKLNATDVQGSGRRSEVFYDTESVTSVVVGRMSMMVELLEDGSENIVGDFNSTVSPENMENNWNAEGRKNMGKSLVAQSFDVEHRGGLVVGIGVLSAIVAIVYALVALSISPLVGLAVLCVYGCLSIMIFALGKFMEFQARATRFMVKESLKDILD